MKKLYKSETDKKIEGVCAGIAEYYGLDPVIIRAASIFITVVTGFIPGLITYLALAWIMPKKSEVKKNG
jgi:phage shock protein C